NAKFSYDQQLQKIESQNTENLLLKKQKFLFIIVSVISLLLFCSALFIVFQINQKNKENKKTLALHERANQFLTYQKQKIEEKNKVLSQQKKEIQTVALELEKANQTKDKFFSIIAHDLKSPFNSILGFSELLLNNYKNYDDDKKEKFLNLIKSSSQSAFTLLENLFTWARAQTGEMQFSPKKLDIKSVIIDVISSTEGSAKQKEIRLINNVNANEFVYGDNNMIGTVLRNLLSNAIKFTNRNGTITVSASTKADNGFIEISVSDTGVGMDKNQVDNLFRIDKNTSTIGTEHEEGTGLGLILCKEFAEKHRGTINVESEFGKGSTFYFSIPLES
ncbi:sensor histidine kinase, partial [Bacteroidota bacterium]